MLNIKQLSLEHLHFRTLQAVIFRIVSSVYFITVLAVILFISLYSQFVSLPLCYQQSYTPNLFLEISFNSRLDEFKNIPTKISFTDKQGIKKKYYSKDFEFSSGNVFTKTTLLLPLVDEISSLDIEFKLTKGSIKICDLRFSGAEIELNSDNISINASDKFLLKDHTLELISKSESPFILDTVAFHIEQQAIERVNPKYNLNDDSIVQKYYYRIVNYLKHHSGTVKIPLVLLLIVVFLKFKKSLFIQLVCFSSSFIYAYTLILFEEAQFLLSGGGGGNQC